MNQDPVSDKLTNMATAEVMSQPTFQHLGNQFPSKREWQVVEDNYSELGIPAETMASENISFDAKKHLAFVPPTKTYTMKDLGLPEDCGISPVAVSEPFPLFSEEAIMQMRTEVLSKEVWKHCKYSSNLAQCQLRGFAPE